MESSTGMNQQDQKSELGHGKYSYDPIYQLAKVRYPHGAGLMANPDSGPRSACPRVLRKSSFSFHTFVRSQWRCYLSETPSLRRQDPRIVNTHVHAFRHKMPFQNLTFLLLGQGVKYKSQLPADRSKNHPPPPGHKHDVILAVPTSSVITSKGQRWAVLR